MNPVLIKDKWCIEVYTKEFGNILILDDSGLPIARQFNSKNEALDYIAKRDMN